MKALAFALCLAVLPAFAQPPEAPEMDAPTTREGYKARNERHVAHEKMFAAQAGVALGVKIPHGVTIETVRHVMYGPGQSLEARTQKLGCTADAVAIVTPYNQRPVLSQNENFIFTEYKVEVNEVMKGALRVGDRITIPRLGGTIQLPDEKIGYDVADYQPLVIGQKYLVFLTYLSATGDYAGTSARGFFEIRPDHTMRSLDGSGPLAADAASRILGITRSQGAPPCDGLK